MNILITGGCGFIGCNTVRRFINMGEQITILDDLSRQGTDSNLAWLRTHGSFSFIKGDVCDQGLVNKVIKEGDFDVIIHLAAQVAVTTSVISPRRDFEINALGTFNVLDAVRLFSPKSIVLNASTNKVYGKLAEIELVEESKRYTVPNNMMGINESQLLDFHSPYGCSKGAADQYIIDFARIYGIKTVSFRQSCIYGYRQFGVEDQGWVAWFMIAHMLGQPITIYGTGKQVRDVLFIDDLIDCYIAAIQRIDQVAGMSFNIGGGQRNTLSLLELIDLLEDHSHRKVNYSFDDWRPGDQPIYISDISKAENLLGWSPKIGTKEGIELLYKWVNSNQSAFVEAAVAV
jgi:CDP-paratose 2-epimerase